MTKDFFRKQSSDANALTLARKYEGRRKKKKKKEVTSLFNGGGRERIPKFPGNNKNKNKVTPPTPPTPGTQFHFSLARCKQISLLALTPNPHLEILVKYRVDLA